MEGEVRNGNDGHWSHDSAPTQPRALHLEESPAWLQLAHTHAARLRNSTSRGQQAGSLVPLKSCLYSFPALLPPRCPSSPRVARHGHSAIITVSSGKPYHPYQAVSLGTLPFQYGVRTQLYSHGSPPICSTSLRSLVCSAHACILRNLQSAQRSASRDMGRRHGELSCGQAGS